MDVLQPGRVPRTVPGTLTQAPSPTSLREWNRWPMALLVVVLACTTIIRAFSYAGLPHYLFDRPIKRVRFLGRCRHLRRHRQRAAMTTVWILADVLLGLGAIVTSWRWCSGRWVDPGALRD